MHVARFSKNNLHTIVRFSNIVLVVMYQSRKVDTKNIFFRLFFSKVDTGDIFCQFTFSKVDTGGIFQSQSFSKVDTVSAGFVSKRFWTNFGTSVSVRFSKVFLRSSSPL